MLWREKIYKLFDFIFIYPRNNKIVQFRKGIIKKERYEKSIDLFKVVHPKTLYKLNILGVRGIVVDGSRVAFGFTTIIYRVIVNISLLINLKSLYKCFTVDRVG